MATLIAATNPHRAHENLRFLADAVLGCESDFVSLVGALAISIAFSNSVDFAHIFGVHQ